MTQRPLLIVNPRSGGGRTGKAFPDMRRTIEAALGPVDVERTARHGHGIELARDGARAGHTLVIAVGGDGTLNEVVNGVMAANAGGAHDARVGLIAQGTGGDFRRSLDLQHRLDHYLDALRSGRERKIDVGRFRFRGPDGTQKEHHFVNILSAGMGGLVDKYVAHAPAALGGQAAYLLSSVRALATCSRGNLRCTGTFRGEPIERRFPAYMLAICNGRFFGSGMKIAPMAELDDGVFEVVTISTPSKAAFALLFTLSAHKLYSGEHMKLDAVDHFRCDRLDVDLENEDARSTFLLDVDGEPLGGLPMSVEVLPCALTLRA